MSQAVAQRRHARRDRGRATGRSTSRATSCRRSSERRSRRSPEALADAQERARRRPSGRGAACARCSTEGGLARMSEPRITQQELESYLWGAATLLRGLIDAGDYKQFIFPLLFFKRLSDVWDEEYQAALDETGGDVDYAALRRERPLPDPDGRALERRARGADAMSARRSRTPCAPSRRPTRTGSTASSATRRGPTRSACPTRRSRPDRALLDADALASPTCPRTNWATATST